MPAKSKKQRKFMGMVHAVQQGKMKAPSANISKAAKSMTQKQSGDFAKTKETKLPVKKAKRKPTYSQVAKSVRKTQGHNY